MDGLIVSRESGESGEWGIAEGEKRKVKGMHEWRDINTDTENSVSGTLSTLR